MILDVGIRAIWGELPREHRRWIVTRAILATAVFNLIINMASAWLGVQGQDEVNLWGVPLVEATILWNSVGILFFLPLITCALITTAVRHDVEVGSLSSQHRLRIAHGWLSVPPTGRLRRGAVFGAIAVVGLIPLLLLMFAVDGFPGLTKAEFVFFETAFAVALGALVTPALALLAMTDPAHD
jgi:hypothetical protein